VACAICGGTTWDGAAAYIWDASQDRGRDHHGKEFAKNPPVSTITPWIGNHRATPTTEAQYPTENQPVGDNPKIVFNGIISNDESLGVHPGEADTSVLPRVLDFSSLVAFRDSLEQKVVGSYAIAAMFQDGEIWLACNYKPIWLRRYRGNIYFSSLRHHFPDGGREAFRFPPYSVGRLSKPSQTLPIRRVTNDNRALVICSSGLDSTAVAAYAISKHEDVLLVHFDYGCAATTKEIHCVWNIAHYLGCSYDVLSIPPTLFGDASKLHGPEDNFAEGIAGAEYAHEWTPARNLIMLSMTVGYAEARKYGVIYLGTNLEESGAYPDNEEQFILDFNNCLYAAVQNGIQVEVRTPLGGLMKHEIVPFGMLHGAPFHLTWSCYRGGDFHCGACGPCFMRKEAFKRNKIKDPVFSHEWDDPFWEGCIDYSHIRSIIEDPSPQTKDPTLE